MRLAALTLALLLTAPAAFALGGEAVEMRDGPGEDARALEPFWIMRCSNATRLVGLRVYADGRVTGVEALCAGLTRDPKTAHIAWLAKPRPWIAPAIPPPPKPVVRIVRPRSEGTILRAESGTVMRYKGSRAEVISVPRAPETPPLADTDGGALVGHPAYLLPFAKAGKGEDLVCPKDQFVLGLRTATLKAELTAVQLICGDGSASSGETIGDWPAASKGQVVAVARVQCGNVAANPLDGAFADAVFGTLDGGRIQSLGLTCTPGAG